MSSWPRRKVFVDNLPQTHDLRFAALFFIGLTVLLGGLYGVGYLVAGDRIPGGTSVAGIDLGNMTTAEAEAELADTLVPRLAKPIRLRGPAEPIALDPAKAGLTVDIAATVDRALDGKSWDPRHMFRVVLGGDDVLPVIAVDQAALDQWLERLAGKLDKPAVESAVTFESGGPQVRPGHAGVKLDVPLARERIIAAFARSSASVRLPLRTHQPHITPTEAANFIARVAGPAVSAPVDITVGRSSLRLRPGDFAQSLATKVDETGLRLAIDPKSLFVSNRAEISALPSSPVDAKFRFDSGEPEVVPGRRGDVVTPRALAESVLRAVTEPGPRSAVPVTKIAPPGFTTREANELQIEERLSSSAVRFEATERKAVKEQAGNLDGTVVGPGRQFDFVRSAGLTEGPGARSVVASATFSAAFNAGMSEFERTANRSYQERFPPGLDAQVTDVRDLRFRNSTPRGVYVRATTTGDSTGGYVTVELWGLPFYDIQVASNSRYDVVDAGLEIRNGSLCQPSPGVDGFDTDVRRVRIRRDGGELIDTIHSSYEAVPTVQCQG